MAYGVADVLDRDATVRIALGDPESSTVTDRSEEHIGDATPAMIRDALARYESLAEVDNVEIRLHQVGLYNSMYRADDQLLINQHAYGISAAHAPVFCLRDTGAKNRQRSISTV